MTENQKLWAVVRAFFILVIGMFIGYNGGFDDAKQGKSFLGGLTLNPFAAEQSTDTTKAKNLAYWPETLPSFNVGQSASDKQTVDCILTDIIRNPSSWDFLYDVLDKVDHRHGLSQYVAVYEDEIYFSKDVRISFTEQQREQVRNLFDWYQNKGISKAQKAVKDYQNALSQDCK